MTRSILLISLIGSLLFGGCEFDNDVEFIPEPIAAYFLLVDDQSNSQSILKVLPTDELFWEYEANLNIAADSVSDLDLWEDELGVAIASEQKVLTFGLPNESLSNTYELAPFHPHLLALGASRIAMVDTNSQEILWINRKDGREIRDTLSGRVERLYYMEPYFFLLEDSVRLKVWEEQSLSLVENSALPQPVSEIIKWELLNRIQFVSESGGDKTLYSWDFGPQVIIENGPVIFNKVEYSPYRRQATGREWVGSIELREDLLPRPGIIPVTDFATQFMNSQLYYHDRDSLWRVDIPTNESNFLSPFPYRFVQSRFYP
ncbi:MAG: hypothetical protein AAFN10_12910 [Bacteroidota bacterium]